MTIGRQELELLLASNVKFADDHAAVLLGALKLAGMGQQPRAIQLLKLDVRENCTAEQVVEAARNFTAAESAKANAALAAREAERAYKAPVAAKPAPKLVPGAGVRRASSGRCRAPGCTASAGRSGYCRSCVVDFDC